MKTPRNPDNETGRLTSQGLTGLSTTTDAWVTPERTLEANPAQTTEAFVAWAPTRRVVRRQFIAPDGKPPSAVPEIEPDESQVDLSEGQQVSALLRALGLAHHWQRLLHDRRMTSVKEIAMAEGMSVAQVNRVLRLTWLAPAIIEWLVRSDKAVLEDVMNRPWPSCWATQMRSVSMPDSMIDSVPD